MKKKISIVLLAVLMLFVTACSSSKDEGKGDGDKKEKVKVALLIGYRGDMSFNDSAIRGVEKARDELGIELKIVEYGTETDKFEPTFIDTAEAGYDIIIAGSTFQDYLEQHTSTYPDTTFIIFDGEVDYEGGKNKNVYSIVYSANEASFVGGYLVTKLSKSGTIGFLGGQEAPIINDFLVGYIQGAKEANPDVKVAASFVGNYNDSSKGKELSLAMNNQKADYIFNVAGGAGLGLIEAAVDKGFYVLGVDSDQAMIYENANKLEFSKVIPTSVMKNVDSSLFRAIDLYIKGELKIGAKEVLGLAENGVGIADNKYYQEMVPEEYRKEVEALLKKVIDKEIVVDTAYGKTTEEIAKIKDSVRP